MPIYLSRPTSLLLDELAASENWRIFPIFLPQRKLQKFNVAPLDLPLAWSGIILTIKDWDRNKHCVWWIVKGGVSMVLFSTPFNKDPV